MTGGGGEIPEGEQPAIPSWPGDSIIHTPPFRPPRPEPMWFVSLWANSVRPSHTHTLYTASITQNLFGPPWRFYLVPLGGRASGILLPYIFSPVLEIGREIKKFALHGRQEKEKPQQDAVLHIHQSKSWSLSCATVTHEICLRCVDECNRQRVCSRRYQRKRHARDNWLESKLHR